LSRSCGTYYPNNSDIRRTFEVENVAVDGLKEAIVGLQINKPDEALILRDIFKWQMLKNIKTDL